MTSKTLGRLIQGLAIALATPFAILPLDFAHYLRMSNPEKYASAYWPWIIFLWAVAVPCLAVLIYIMKVSQAIERDKVFTNKTANWIKTSAILLFAGTGFFFAGNVVFLLLKMSDLKIFQLSIFASMFALALATLAAILSRYIVKAAVLQEESEGTL